jgi:FlaG/FlaF family flagellin (archaellin)
MKNLRKSAKAISPIIATLMLMLLAVAAGVIVYAYVTGWIGGATQTSGAPKGQLQVDSITATTTTIQVYIRNLGGEVAKVDAIYVEGNAVASVSPSLPQTIDVGKVQGFTLGSLTLTQGHFYKVTVVCADGTTISQSVKAE